ncbi:MAG: ribonuclease III [Actinomycetota bacterium]|nr:ribonuclease III [Actinomycetota bacterium]
MEGITDGAARLAERLGHDLEGVPLLQRALSHRSWCAEQGGPPSNERLEFLGDAVLGLVVAEYCYRRFPEMPEGELAKVRAAVVNARVLAEVAEQLGIGDALLLGKGEEASGGRTKPSILADALEAVLGALYLESGWTAAERVILTFLGPRIERAAAEPDDFDQKGLLQELTVRQGEGIPRYVVVGSGPDHDRQFEAAVFVNGLRRGAGVGGTKKDAEQEAARQALSELRRA